MGGLRKKLHHKLTKRPGCTETPWIDSMSTNYHRASSSAQNDGGDDDAGSAPQATVAAFSPNQQTATKRRDNAGSILIHQKSPLLVATPPQVTRALAYSHPFILPLNHVAGLMSWTTGDPWESFLLLAGFWFTALYGDAVVRWAGPVVVVVGLILGLYSRRYSPLSSTVWSGEKARRRRASSEERKSLDEILETLQTFTARCDVLLDPFLRLTEFLSTQSSATSATTRPALTTLFLRILAITPVWILLALPPFYILTTQRVILALGTLGLSWHSRPARVTRTILWRSKTIRNLASLTTGLSFTGPSPPTTTAPPLPTRPKGASFTTTVPGAASPGVRFTFTLYENQRRWLGLGWTASLLAYERQAWSDEHLNTAPSPEEFELPETDHETTRWRWVPGSDWHVEGAATTVTGEKEKSAKRIGGGGGGDDVGWVYYDNKWLDGRKTDGWGRYTRRRKWIRDAELVDINTSDDSTLVPTSSAGTADSDATATPNGGNGNGEGGDTASVDSTAKRKSWFSPGGGKKVRPLSMEKTGDKTDALSKTGSMDSTRSTRSRDGPEDDVHTPSAYRHTEWDRSIGEGVMQGLS